MMTEADDQAMMNVTIHLYLLALHAIPSPVPENYSFKIPKEKQHISWTALH
jgi:hypothetical protein